MRFTDLVVVLNMVSVGGFSKSWGLVEVSQISPEVGIVHYTLLVALCYIMDNRGGGLEMVVSCLFLSV